jgi:hypothetical protein
MWREISLCQFLWKKRGFWGESSVLNEGLVERQNKRHLNRMRNTKEINTIKKSFDFQSGTGRFFIDISIEPPPAPKRALIPGRLGDFLTASMKQSIHQEFPFLVIQEPPFALKLGLSADHPLPIKALTKSFKDKDFFRGTPVSGRSTLVTGNILNRYS